MSKFTSLAVGKFGTISMRKPRRLTQDAAAALGPSALCNNPLFVM